MSELNNKIIIVTGAASGIGAATALEVLAAGGKLAASDINWIPGSHILNSLESSPKAIRLDHDVSQTTAWNRVIDSTLATFGRIDGLVNNAGRAIAKPLEETSFEQWQTMADVNVKGVFLGCRAVHPAMLKQGGGAIVNVVSAAGIQYFPNMAAYSATKSGCASFTRAAMIDFAKDNIRVNGVMPGTVKTGMTTDLLDLPEFVESVINKHALKRAAEPAEIANVIVFLLSDEASYVNGINMPVDGGLTIT